MRIAILGGTFNPLHIGHLALADDVRTRLGYDRILLIPANIPPHKELAGGAGAADRLEMLRRAASDTEWLGVEDCEIVRGGVSYTIDTVTYLEEKYALELEGKIGLVIGQDLVPGFSTWKNAAVIAERTDIILALRPGSTGVQFDVPHIPLENPLLTVSSSDIRARISSGKSWRYLVPDPVYRYIVEHNLYEQ